MGFFQQPSLTVAHAYICRCTWPIDAHTNCIFTADTLWCIAHDTCTFRKVFTEHCATHTFLKVHVSCTVQCAMHTPPHSLHSAHFTLHLQSNLSSDAQYTFRSVYNILNRKVCLHWWAPAHHPYIPPLNADQCLHQVQVHCKARRPREIVQPTFNFISSADQSANAKFNRQSAVQSARWKWQSAVQVPQCCHHQVFCI